MAFAHCDENEKNIIKKCLEAGVKGPFFEDWEFSSLIGVERKKVEEILLRWPNVYENDEMEKLAINNLIGNLLGYPHGMKEELIEILSCSLEDLKIVFEKWKKP